MMDSPPLPNAPPPRPSPRRARIGLAGLAMLVLLAYVHPTTRAFWSTVVRDRTSPLTLALGPPAPRLGGPSGFDLSELAIGKGEIHAGGPGKDGIPALVDPRVISADAAHAMGAADRVIGVAFGNTARAYPLRILDWHEAVNDTVAGRSLLVTYCPLCDSAAVFDRAGRGRARQFGVSGLLYNSNVLLYGRGGRDPLYSQLMASAVSGPQSRTPLPLLPCELTTWASWRNRHPQTDVLSFDTGYSRPYDV